MISTFFIFGASGDLTGRYLMPAFARLEQEGFLPPELEIRGIDRRDWSSDQFRRHIGERLEKHAPETSPRSHTNLLQHLEYRRADVAQPDEVAAAVESPGGSPAVSYLALPSVLFAPAIQA